MAKSLNQVIVMGNVTRTPDIKQTPSGNSVVSFSLALNRSYKDAQDQWQEPHSCGRSSMGKLADRVAERLTQALALVSGRFKSRSWKTKDRCKAQKLKHSHKMSHLDAKNKIEITQG